MYVRMVQTNVVERIETRIMTYSKKKPCLEVRPPSMASVRLSAWRITSMRLTSVLKDLNFSAALCKWKYAKPAVEMPEILNTLHSSHAVLSW